MASPHPARDPAEVRAMFGRIAPRYDLANTVLRFGRDASWRRRAAVATGLEPGQAAIDVACGTGMLAAELARVVGPRGRVVGADFSPPMLGLAARRHPGIEWRESDALGLPFDEASFDAATMAFGLRNLSDPSAGAREMARVVRPGGRLVILEFVRPPRSLAGRAYRLYLERLLPVAGGVISGDRAAYAYLSTTIDRFMSAAEMQETVRAAGWQQVRLELMNAGTVALVAGVRGGGPTR